MRLLPIEASGRAMLLNRFGRENGRTLRARLHHPCAEQELWGMGSIFGGPIIRNRDPRPAENSANRE